MKQIIQKVFTILRKLSILNIKQILIFLKLLIKFNGDHYHLYLRVEKYLIIYFYNFFIIPLFFFMLTLFYLRIHNNHVLSLIFLN